MRKFYEIITVALLVVVVLGAFNGVCAQDNKLLIAGDEEKKGSYLLEITDAAFKRAGYEPGYALMPWVRALSGTISGQYDVLLGAYYTEERARSLLYSKPIGSSEVVLLKLKKRDISYEKIEDLKPYKIGSIRSSKVSKEFDAAEETYLQMEYATDSEPNIKKLLAGRLDLVVEKKARLQYLLDTVFKDYAYLVDYVQPPLERNYYHICVSKKHARAGKLIEDFNRGLQMIKDDGTFAAILREHGIMEE